MPGTYITKIAVVGATGTVGKHITAELLATGKHKVTAITRSNSDKAMPDGVNVVRVDYQNKEELVQALKGQEALIITLGVQASMDDTQRNLIDAAAEAGVKWIMPNEYSPDFGAQVQMGEDALLGPGIIATRKYIESLGVSSWVSLVCSFWYQHCLIAPLAYGFDIPNRKLVFFDDGRQKITHSTLPQCGKAVAALFSLPLQDSDVCLQQWKNKECYCSSFCLSQRDMLDAVLRVTGDGEADWEISHEPSFQRWRNAQDRWSAGDSYGRFVAMTSRVFFPDGSGDLTSKLDDARLGLPKEDVIQATEEAVEMALAKRTYRDFSTVKKDA